MAQESRRKKFLPRPKNYEKFRDSIERVLREANGSLTWTEIKEKAGFRQKVPNNKWVRRMEEDIGLLREKTKEGKTLWKLGSRNERDSL